MPRQTDMPLLELIRELSEPRTDFPRCFTINEIGEACLSGEDNDGEGKKILLSLLDSEDEEDRAIAFAWVCSIPYISNGSSSEIERFRANPSNSHLINIADTMIERARQQTMLPKRGDQGLFEVFVCLKRTGRRYKTFHYAFARFYRGIRVLVDGGTSWQVLETTNHLVYSGQNGIRVVLDWYEARDITYALGLMQEDRLMNPLPRVTEERFFAALSVASRRN